MPRRPTFSARESIPSFPAFSTGVDPATDFIIRAGITDNTQKNAIITLVSNLVSAGLWGKMLALYPYVGGTAGSHAVNLINSSYTISWTGGVTHDANGITGNGTTGFGNTGLNPSVIGLTGGLTYYCRGLPLGDNNVCGVNNATDNFILNLNITAGNKAGHWGLANAAASATAPAVGMYSVSRLSSTSLALYFNGSSIATNVTSTNVTPAAVPFYVLCRNNNGTASSFSEQNDALHAFHQGLTAGETSSLYTAVQAFQTTLGRQV